MKILNQRDLFKMNHLKNFENPLTLSVLVAIKNAKKARSL